MSTHVWKIHKDDNVMILVGKDKGKIGKIVKILRSKKQVIVEKANMVKKHTKPNAANPQGGIIEQEAPVHISNLMLVDPKTGEATRIGRKKDANGKLVRYSKKSGEEIK